MDTETQRRQAIMALNNAGILHRYGALDDQPGVPLSIYECASCHAFAPLFPSDIKHRPACPLKRRT